MNRVGLPFRLSLMALLLDAGAIASFSLGFSLGGIDSDAQVLVYLGLVGLLPPALTFSALILSIRVLGQEQDEGPDRWRPLAVATAGLSGLLTAIFLLWTVVLATTFGGD